MFTELRIKNYKSILDHTMELGRVTVLIGENGSGKSNILEAIAMAAAAHANRLEAEDLYNRGMRIAKPLITFSSFRNIAHNDRISFILSRTEDQRNNSKSISLDIMKETTPDQKEKWICGNSPTPPGMEGMEKLNITKTFLDLIRHLDTKRIKLATPESSNTDRVELSSYAKKLLSALDGNPEIMKIIIDNYSKPTFNELEDFLIYNANQFALRGLETNSRKEPVGINGENLDVFLASMNQDELSKLNTLTSFIPWFKGFLIDKEDNLKFAGFKPGRSTSRLYFKDRFMKTRQNIFSAENANEGILHILFYASLFISRKTPPFFAIDNIEASLNPQLCRELMKRLSAVAKEHNKQAIITTHNPAVLDGLNLHDDDQRLLVVYRNDEGHTVTKRIKVKPESGDGKYKLSELWMRGHLGGIPKTF